MRPQILRLCYLSCLILSTVSLLSCSLGKKNILFLTKTSLGVDIDSKPPTLDVSYTRKEGTLSPEYSSGVLPQMASFSTSVSFPVNTAVGQSFATGHAAALLAKYIGTPADPDISFSIPESEITRSVTSRIAGTVASGRRYFFGTDTTFGLKVTFGLETGGYPDSLSLGYKRKELAFVPISEKTNNGNTTVGLPSLLATAGFDFAGQQGGGSLQYIQFFATGNPASYLAAKRAIRNTVGIRIIGDQQTANAIIARSKEYVSAAIQATVQSLRDRVDQLDDTKAVDLYNNPPPELDPGVEIQVQTIVAGKTVDGPLAKQATKRRIAGGDRSKATLDTWDAAIKAKEN